MTTHLRTAAALAAAILGLAMTLLGAARFGLAGTVRDAGTTGVIFDLAAFAVVVGVSTVVVVRLAGHRDALKG